MIVIMLIMMTGRGRKNGAGHRSVTRGRSYGGAGYRSHGEQFAGLRVVDALPGPHAHRLLFRAIEADGK